MTYSIDTGDGDELCAGLQGYDAARKAAQRLANDLGEAVYLYSPEEARAAEEAGEEHESEEIEPGTVRRRGDLCLSHASCDGTEIDCRDSSGARPGTGRGLR